MKGFYPRTNKYEGKPESYDMMHNGVKVGEMSYYEVLELIARLSLVAAERERK